MLYLTLKGIHLATIATTIALFLLRSVWAFAGSSRLRMPVMHWLPHVNDSLLLASALATAAVIHQYPFVHSWLTAKILALVVYILLGHITLWRARNNAWRTLWFTSALITFAYIVLVARCHDPRAWLCVQSLLA